MEASCSPLIENHSAWRFGFKLKIAVAIAKHREARAVKSLRHHVRCLEFRHMRVHTLQKACKVTRSIDQVRSPWQRDKVSFEQRH